MAARTDAAVCALAVALFALAFAAALLVFRIERRDCRTVGHVRTDEHVYRVCR